MSSIYTQLARQLRQSATDAERRLWCYLQGSALGVKFRRQTLIGHFIVDFVSFEKKLVIEVDGSQHFDSASDRERDAWLQSQGFRILRFWNYDVLRHTAATIEVIQNTLDSLPLTPTLSRQGRGGNHA